VQTKLAAEERDVQRALEAAIAHDDPQRRCERHEKKIQELQEELLNIREDLDNRTDMVNALNTMHMSTNDELQEAKKAAINSILYPICKMIVMQMGAADFLSFVCSF
jgi:superfamily II RNA helicase